VGRGTAFQILKAKSGKQAEGAAMTVSIKHAEWIAVVLFVALIGLVFQQAATSMASQGIASGGPYNDAAAYPKLIAVALGLLTALQIATQYFRKGSPSGNKDGGVPLSNLARPFAVVVVFAAYLGCLDILGYHIATPIMLAALMLLGGIRRAIAILLPAILISIGLAYVFEAWLKIVLPGGLLHLNISW
jgi:putative tricarboxylic transport membrane protein